MSNTTPTSLDTKVSQPPYKKKGKPEIIIEPKKPANIEEAKWKHERECEKKKIDEERKKKIREMIESYEKKRMEERAKHKVFRKNIISRIFEHFELCIDVYNRSSNYGIKVHLEDGRILLYSKNKEIYIASDIKGDELELRLYLVKHDCNGVFRFTKNDSEEKIQEKTRNIWVEVRDFILGM